MIGVPEAHDVFQPNLRSIPLSDNTFARKRTRGRLIRAAAGIGVALAAIAVIGLGAGPAAATPQQPFPADGPLPIPGVGDIGGAGGAVEYHDEVRCLADVDAAIPDVPAERRVGELVELRRRPDVLADEARRGGGVERDARQHQRSEGINMPERVGADAAELKGRVVPEPIRRKAMRRLVEGNGEQEWQNPDGDVVKRDVQGISVPGRGRNCV